MRIQHLTASMLAVVALYLSGCSLLTPKSTTSVPVAPVASTPPHAPAPPVKIGLALGGGAARGFAHIGVIKALEAQGIVPDVIVGTSAGAVVGALYASGMSGFDLQKVALDLADKQIVGWAWPNRGWLDGEVLQTFINKAVGNRVLEALPRKLSVMATDLKTGEGVAFATGNTGMAVRASAAVPGVFQPVQIAGREYVDGGLVSPIPVREARRLGATFVIAVDISSRPTDGATGSTFDVLMQTFSIMGKTIGRYETADADIAIHPEISSISPTDLAGRHHAILEGEKAAAAVLVELKRKLAKARTNE